MTVLRRRWWLAASAGALAAVVLVVATLVEDGGDGPQEARGALVGVVTPRPAPVVTLAGVRTASRQVTVPGRTPAIVNFFASWCVPCKEELPVLQEIWERHGDDVAVVGVDVQDNRGKAVELLDDTGARFPAGYDPDRDTAGKYALNGMPTTFFVDRDGRIVGRVQGKVSEATLRRWVDHLRAPDEAG